MKHSVLIFSKKKNQAAKTVTEELAGWLKKKGYRCLDLTDQEKISSSAVKEVSLGVVIGGDGTFLTLVRRLERKDLFPLVGINLGTLGFITEIHREEMLASVEEILKKRFHEERRPLFRIELHRGGKALYDGLIFNDVVLSKDAPTSMLKMDVVLGGQPLYSIKADGYIFATPTGSSAYALSAGGPILHPAVNACLLVPICAHSIAVRPTVTPEDLEVEIHTKDFVGKAYLAFDGKTDVEVTPRDVIRISKSDQTLRLIRPETPHWSQTLRTKLHMI